jgi:hypothetical protein
MTQSLRCQDNTRGLKYNGKGERGIGSTVRYVLSVRTHTCGEHRKCDWMGGGGGGGGIRTVTHRESHLH